MASETQTGLLKVGRVCLIIVNITYMAMGIALITIGALIFRNAAPYAPVVVAAGPYIPSMVMMAGGLLLLLTSVLGVLALVRRERNVLIAHLSLVVVLIVVMVFCLAVGYEFQDELKTRIRNSVKTSIERKYDGSGHNVATVSIDSIQSNFMCCGATTYKDWERSRWSEAHPSYMVPPSCCRNRTQECYLRVNFDANNLFSKNCVDEINLWSDKKLLVVWALALAFLLFLILGATLALLVLSRTKPSDTVKISNMY